MITIAWIFGILLIFAGLAWLMWLYLQYGFNNLSKAEAEMMKKDGLLPGEPEYMRDFRVARAEGDIVDIGKHIRVALAFIIMGILILLYFLIFR